MKTLNWKLPPVRPRYADRGGAAHWQVIADEALGKAWAVCVPVNRQPGGWTLALAAAQASVGTTPVVTRHWTELTPVAADPAATHTVCLLGYDQPPGAGGVFRITSFATVMPPVLQQVVAALEAAMGPELDTWLLPADPPAGPLPASFAAPAGRAAASASAVHTPRGAPPPASLTLAFASCQYPSGLLDKLPAERSYERLAALLRNPGARKPSVLLLLGDQVYVDATAGLLDPMRVDDRYRVPYEELRAIEPLQFVLQQRLRTEWMLDDHEIADNWEPRRPGDTGKLYDRGLAAYWTHQRARQGQPLPPTWSAYPAASGWALFMADTRTLRDQRCEATLDTAQILGAPQRAALEQWLLATPREDLKLVASPAMLLPRLVEHMDEPLHLDGWQGFPASLHGLLAFLCDHQIPNVYFLSGDAHLGCDVDIAIRAPGGATVRTRSVHTPALYAPLPFANERPWNLKLKDSFRFPDPQHGPYTCRVRGSVRLPARDGCCLLEADRDASGWTVTTQVV